MRQNVLGKSPIFSLLFTVAFACVCGNKTVGIVPQHECNRISGMEIRYNEFYELYLGHDSKYDELQEHGIIHRSLRGAVNACCPGLKLNFTHVDESIEDLVQEDILHHHDLQRQQNSSNLVFYFPEFATQGKLGND